MKTISERLENITDQISLLEGEGSGGFPNSHSILISDKKTVLIDTGCGIKTLEQLRKEYEISYVINSHTHPDHSAGNWVFKDKPIHVPEQGLETSGNLVALSRRFVSEELASIWRRYIKKLLGFKDCKPTHSYNEQTVFNLGKITVEPVYTPGHTIDHYCFYEQNQRILFSFDYDFLFPWYGHRESSLQEFRKSLKKLKDLSPKIVVSSHRGIITENIDAEFDKYSRIIEERDDEILSLLETEKTINQFLESLPIYGKFPPYFKSPDARRVLLYWERQMIEKHLKQLKREGRVKGCGNSYIRI